MNELLLYWALPSAVTLLMVIRLVAFEQKTTVAEFDKIEWFTCLTASVLYPIGFTILVCDVATIMSREGS